jgi:hypothetical protein
MDGKRILAAILFSLPGEVTTIWLKFDDGWDGEALSPAFTDKYKPKI